MTKIPGIVALLCSFAICISVFAETSVEVRLSHNSIVKDQMALYVDVEIRATDRMNLAGQNYRVYYPSDIVSVDSKGSSSKLSHKKYSPLRFSNVLEHIKSRDHGNIEFDQDLGFVNFYVELLDLKSGGEVIDNNDGWVKMATLKFNLKKEIESLEMLWGREGLSENYATAFVQIAEWQENMNTRDVKIHNHIDYKYLSNVEGTPEGVEISIGPNPTKDQVYIAFDKIVDANLTVDIQDIAGKHVKTIDLMGGSKLHTLDLSDLQSSSYLITLSKKSDRQLIHTAKILVTQ
ncbi:MAG: hypothetical protein ACJA01_000383 [Saprospiraceae bacterium]|jgi:hypothetical protein